MSFLLDYGAYTEGDEVPAIYHMWSGISALSHIIGRRVWFDQQRFKVFPQLYCILVSDPGGKKSSAMRASRSLVCRVDPTIQFAASCDTRESILQKMGAKDSECLRKYCYNGTTEVYSQLSIFADEFVNLVNAGGNPGGMIDFLTQVFTEQGDFRNDTKNKGKDLIVKPYVSILACMTSDVAASLASTKIISSGMTRRSLFIYGPQGDTPHALLELTNSQREACERLIAHGRAMLAAAGEFKLTGPGKEVYTRLYNKDFYRKRTETSTVFKSFLETKPEYVLKIAMLLALSNDPSCLELNGDDIEAAFETVSEIEKGCMQLFDNVGRNVLSPIASNIERLISIEPSPILVKRIYVMESRNASTQDIDLVISDMCRMDKAMRFWVTIKNARSEFISTPEKAQAYLDTLKASGVQFGTS